MSGMVRKFETGATRDVENGKLDFDGFLSVDALRAFADYMHRHSIQSDGSWRDGGNWKKGMPTDVYMKSMWRHFFDVWALHNGTQAISAADQVEALCALWFNVQGMLLEVLRGQRDE